MKVHVFKRGILSSDVAIRNYRNIKVVYCGYLDVQDPFNKDLWDLCNWSCWSDSKPIECEYLQITHCNADVAYYINGIFYNHEMNKFRDFKECYNEMTSVYSKYFDDMFRIAYGFNNLDEANLHDIFMCEQALAGNNKVFIISAFPEFLVDYFGMKLWRTCVKHAKNQLDICNCK